MTSSLKHEASSAVLVACSVAFAFLILAVLPLALYQYFEISSPSFVVEIQAFIWLVYLAPIDLFAQRAPTLPGVDPLMTLLPTFAITFVLWSLAFFVLILVSKSLHARNPVAPK